MATIDDVLVKVAEESVVIDALIALVSAIRQELIQAQSQVGQITPEMEAKILQVFEAVNNNTAKISEAVVAGTAG